MNVGILPRTTTVTVAQRVARLAGIAAGSTAFQPSIAGFSHFGEPFDMYGPPQRIFCTQTGLQP